MATVTDFIQSRSEIIEAALRKIGALSLGNTVTASQMDAGVKALNTLVKSWQTKSLFLWTLSEFSLATVVGTEAYTIEPSATGVTGLVDDLLGFDSAYYLQGTDWLPVEVISYRDYVGILNKESATGQPAMIATRPTESPLTAYIWPSPQAIYTMKIIGIAKLKDWDSTSANGSIPTRFQRALIWGLAAELAPDYGLPVSERQYFTGEAERFFAEAKASDRDRSDGEFIRGAF